MDIMEKNKKIEFEYGNEKQIKVSKAGKEESIFYDGYLQAAASVVEIIQESKRYSNAQSTFSISSQDHMADRMYLSARDSSQDHMTNSMYSPARDKKFYNYQNNIIVFEGERGAGKSSAMLTFIDSLQSKKRDLLPPDDCFYKEIANKYAIHMGWEEIKSCILDTHYLVLSPIDPSALEEGQQILVTFLAKLYEAAKERWEQLDNDRFASETLLKSKQQRADLLQKFSQCYDHIRQIKVERLEGENAEYDGLDYLDKLGDISCLKKEFEDLVESLLVFQYGDSSSSCVILQIDDTDMNMKKGYDVLEDIRRYLFIPRVIIVMAADLDHFTDVVERRFLAVQQASAGSSRSLGGYSVSPRELATQYIAKLFPQTRQILLSNLGQYFREFQDNISVYYKVNKVDVLRKKKGQEAPASLGAQITILDFIARKTGIVFLPYHGEVHPIIPTNMRILGNFLAVLSQMKDIGETGNGPLAWFAAGIREISPEGKLESIQSLKSILDNHLTLNLEVRARNIQFFRFFFLGTWLNTSLEKEHIHIIKEIDNAGPSRKVALACELLDSSFSDRLLSKKETLSCIFSEKTYASLFARTQYIRQIDSREEIALFLFAIECYFTVLSHELVANTIKTHYCTLLGEIDRIRAGGVVEPEDFLKIINIVDNECDFSGLFDIFGVDPLKYLYTDFRGSDQEISENIRAENNIIANLPVDSGRGESSVRIRWRVKKAEIDRLELEASKEGQNPLKRQIEHCYKAMLLKRKSAFSDDSEELEMDIFSSFVNPVYFLQQESGVIWSPDARRESDIGFIPGFCLNKLQERAFSVLLSWDIQKFLSSALRPLIKFEDSPNPLYLPKDYSSWCEYLGTLSKNIRRHFWQAILSADEDCPSATWLSMRPVLLNMNLHYQLLLLDSNGDRLLPLSSVSSTLAQAKTQFGNDIFRVLIADDELSSSSSS